jgi:hypothetical protein
MCTTFNMHILQVFLSSLEYIYPYLKIVYNEKQGGLARWLLLVMSIGHWRSRFFLNFAVVFSSTYFPFPSRTDKILGNFHVIRRSAPNRYIYLFMTNDAPDGPCAISNRATNKKQKPRNTVQNLKAHRKYDLCRLMTQGALFMYICLHLP